MAIKRELSLALVGLAGGLLVGNFAAFNGFLVLANAFGDQVVTWLLLGSTLLLTLSIIFGGWGISAEPSDDQSQRFDWQAKAGLAGLLAALAMPISSLWFLEPPNSTQADQILVLQQALASANAERIATAAQVANLSEEIQSLAVTLEQLATQ